MERDYLVLILSGILYGTITFGGQFLVNLGFSAYEIALFSLFFMCLIMLPLALFQGQPIFQKRYIPFFVLFGLINALQEISQFASISMNVPVAVVSFLLYSQPIWTIFLGRMVLKERITKVKIIAVIIAIAGLIFLLEPWNAMATLPLKGIIFGILGGVFISLWIILGRKSKDSEDNNVLKTNNYMVFSFMWLLLLYPIIKIFIQDTAIMNLTTNFSSNYWVYFIIFALLSGVLPSLLFFKGIKTIDASIASIILLLEPISATILAVIFFRQPLTLNIILGGALILVSNYLVLRLEGKKGKK